MAETSPLMLAVAALRETMEANFPDASVDDEYYSFPYYHAVLGHPLAQKLELSCELDWSAEKETLKIVIVREEGRFAPWHEEEMHCFFSKLTYAVLPYVTDFIPEDALQGGINAYRPVDEQDVRALAYLGVIDYRSLDPQELVNLVLVHVSLGTECLYLTQQIFEALCKGERSDSFDLLLDQAAHQKEKVLRELSSIPSFVQ